ncbi:hypothetical protein BVC80_8607g8 [Macleaya cordata]|uniref:Zinc finger protein n=1 Tax=Macleaya cordata TaxID=56857 RepID=A0A200PYH4_MACCD|nr:hypothetical protein BVC80_8607g8 [Macleaya cordata]
MLSTRVGMTELSEARLIRYIDGFQPRISTELKLREIETLEKATEYARKLEEYFNSLQDSSRLSTIVISSAAPRITEAISVPFKCFDYGGLGHRAAECPKKKNRKLLIVENEEQVDTDPITEDISDHAVNKILIAEFEAIGPETKGDSL